MFEAPALFCSMAEERGLFCQPVRSFNGDEYILNEGDCIYIDANTDHSYHKLGDEECVSVWVYASLHATPMADSFVL